MEKDYSTAILLDKDLTPSAKILGLYYLHVEGAWLKKADQICKELDFSANMFLKSVDCLNEFGYADIME